MKVLIISLLFSSSIFAAAPDISEAPMGWLVANTLTEKLDDHGHLKEDKLVVDIFNTIEYNAEDNELIINENKRTRGLRSRLVQFISKRSRTKQIDPLYQKWKKEGSSKINVRTRKVQLGGAGFYFFNHIHTNISQDNSSLKILKIKPEKTIELVKGFLKKRKAKGVAALTDHDTDRGFDTVKFMADENLGIKRGIEWGGSTHMCLIDIKENWDLLSKGRTFK